MHHRVHRRALCPVLLSGGVVDEVLRYGVRAVCCWQRTGCTSFPYSD